MVFIPMKKGERRPRWTLEKVVQKDLMMNDISEVWSLIGPNGVI